MGSPTHFYVDPTVASDGGSGTVGSPWTRADGQVEQYAMDNGTYDTTHGVQINIKSGTRHTTLNATRWTSSWNPQPHYHLTFRGYDSAANDGGRADLDWGGTASTIWSPNENYCEFVDCDFKDWRDGSNGPAAGCSFINCSFTTTFGSSVGVLSGNSSQDSHFYNCRFDLENTTNSADNNCCINTGQGQFIRCYIKTRGRSAIRFNDFSANMVGCVINHECLDANSMGINLDATTNCKILRCSFYNRGTKLGSAIYSNTSATYVVESCYFENFTNVLETNAHEHFILWHNNYYYDCTNLWGGNAYEPRTITGDTQLLSQTVFNDAANEDFTPVTTDEKNVYLGDPDGGSLNQHYFIPGALGASAGGGGGRKVIVGGNSIF